MDVARFVGIEPTEDPDRWELPVRRAICGGRDSIYGGCGLAAAVIAAERVTGRETTWATCQFLRPARIGDTVSLRVEVSAAGRAVAHTRVIATVDDAEVFAAFISVGERDFPAEAVHAVMPDVPDPELCPPRYILESNRGGIREEITERAVTDDPSGVMDAPDGHSAVWITMPDGLEATAAALALVGDEVSTGTSAVFDPDTQAPSIDNTLRIVAPVATPWVLADIEVRAASRGFAHGIVNLWSRDGELMAIATQTGALRIRGT